MRKRNDPMDLDFTKEEEGHTCPFSQKICTQSRWIYGVAAALGVLFASLLTFGIVKTVRLFLSFT